MLYLVALGADVSTPAKQLETAGISVKETSEGGPGEEKRELYSDNDWSYCYY